MPLWDMQRFRPSGLMAFVKYGPNDLPGQIKVTTLATSKRGSPCTSTGLLR